MGSDRLWLPQIAEAAASFDSAAKLAPTLDEAWRNAGTAYQHLGQPDIAEGARALQSSVHAAESYERTQAPVVCSAYPAEPIGMRPVAQSERAPKSAAADGSQCTARVSTQSTPCGHGGGRQPVHSPSFCMRIARNPFKARAPVARVCWRAGAQRISPEA